MADEPENPPPSEPAEQRPEDAAKSELSLREKRILWLKPYRWQPGQSGNPLGRPKHVASAYEELLEMEITPRMTKVLKLPADFAGLSFREALALGMGGAAAMGKTEAAKEIADRVDGKVEGSLRIQDESSMAEILRKLWEKKMGTTAPPAIDTTVVTEGEETLSGLDDAGGGDGDE